MSEDMVVKELYDKNMIPSQKESLAKSNILLIGVMFGVMILFMMGLSARIFEHKIIYFMGCGLFVLAVAFFEMYRIRKYVEGVEFLEGNFIFGDASLDLSYRVSKHFPIIIPSKPISDLSSEYSEDDIVESANALKLIRKAIVGKDEEQILSILRSGKIKSNPVERDIPIENNGGGKSVVDVVKELGGKLPKGVELVVQSPQVNDVSELSIVFRFGRYYVERVETIDKMAFYVVSHVPFSEAIPFETGEVYALEFWATVKRGFGIFKFLDYDRDPETDNLIPIYWLAYSDYFVRTSRIVDPRCYKSLSQAEANIIRDAIGLYYVVWYKKDRDELLRYVQTLLAHTIKTEEDRIASAQRLAAMLYDVHMFSKSGLGESVNKLMDLASKGETTPQTGKGFLKKHFWKIVFGILGAILIYFIVGIIL